MFKVMNSAKILSGALLGILLLFPVDGWSGEDDQESPRLTVSAEGKLDVPPDKAVLSFAVETVGEKLSEVQKENQERLAKVLEECRALTIPSQFIQTTSLNVIPEYPPPPRRPSDGSLEKSIPRIIGYRVVHQVNVEIRNLELVGKVVDRVLKVGANRFSGISWGLQNEQPTRLEVLKQASVKAQAKAETLAEALNLKLVRMINVLEGEVSPVPREGRYRMATMAMDSGAEASVSAGEISIRGTVTLVYEISQK
ncbi:MAG: SIMPL domain-containing protein [Nitrospirales bacterium]